MGSSAVLAQAPVDVGLRRELFVDDALIEKLGGLRRELQHPVPQQIAIEHNSPWEGAGSAYHSLIRDGELYRLYYRGSQLGVENGRLILDTANRDENGRRKVIKHGVTAKVTLPALNAIDAAGVVDGDVRGISAESFTADVSGVGDLNLSGSCGVFDADVSGVGELDAEALECRTVTVDVSGVGSAKVFASEAVEAEMAGIGKIEVYGSPATVSKSQSSPLGRISIR